MTYPEQDAHAEGGHALETGKSPESNPYNPDGKGAARSEAWQSGWEESATAPFTVYPSYCTGNNVPFLATAEKLHSLLKDELCHQYGREIAGLSLGGHEPTLNELLGLGGDSSERWRFDVTPSGCVQSTITVIAKSAEDHRKTRIIRLRSELAEALAEATTSEQPARTA